MYMKICTNIHSLFLIKFPLQSKTLWLDKWKKCFRLICFYYLISTLQFGKFFRLMSVKILIETNGPPALCFPVTSRKRFFSDQAADAKGGCLTKQKSAWDASRAWEKLPINLPWRPIKAVFLMYTVEHPWIRGKRGAVRLPLGNSWMKDSLLRLIGKLGDWKMWKLPRALSLMDIIEEESIID